MRALLIYPEYPETFWSFKYALRFIAKKAVYPPLGLLTVAAMLPVDWEVRLVDMNVTTLRPDHLQWAEVVLISAMAIQTRSVREVIARCRAQGVPIVAGGPLFTAMPDDFPEVDHLVLNEAEVTLPAFLDDFARGHARHCYTSTARADLATSPIPRWELMEAKHYAAMSLQYSRGCPFDCEFCNITSLFGRTPRTKHPAQVLAELDRLYGLGWRGTVFFVDDNLIGPLAKVKTGLLPAMAAWSQRRKYAFTFTSQASINLADDPALLDLMTRVGFSSVFIGIESPNESSLAECQKTQNAGRDLLASVRAIQHAGLQVQAGFIVGFDNDPASIFDRLTTFIQESGIVTAMVGLLNAPHGTRLYQRLQTEGRVLHEMSGDNTDYSLNFVPKMPADLLLRGYRNIIESLYTPNAYYARVKQFLRGFSPPRRRTWDVKISDVVTVAKATVVLGVIEKERTYFWRLFFWSLFTRPRLIPMALAFTACGFHFRKSFERC